MTNTIEASTPTEIHPSWCDQFKCYEGREGSGTHGTNLPGQGVAGATVEQLAYFEGGRALTLEPVISLRVQGSGTIAADHLEELSVQDCRDIIAVLTAAVDRLDAINAEAS